MRSKERAALPLIAAFCAGLCILSALIISAKDQKLQSTRTAASIGAFDELCEAAESLRISLSRLRYASDRAGQIENLSSISAAAALGTSALARLRLSADGGIDESAAGFFIKIADYSLSLIKGADGGAYDTEVWSELYLYAEELSHTLALCRNEVYRSDASAEALTEAISSIANSAFLSGGSQAMFSNMPRLIYDGPYSDEESAGGYEMIRAASAASENEINAVLKSMLGDTARVLRREGVINADIAVIKYSCNNISAEISERGGYPLRLLRYEKTADATMDIPSAQAAAEKYLAALGFENMQCAYYLQSEGAVNFRFVYRDMLDDGTAVLCYADAITVGVAPDSGKVVFFDAYDYVKNHYDRALNYPPISGEEAKASLDGSLYALSCRMAVIPQNGAEKFVYEFLAENGRGEQMLIYVGTTSGSVIDTLYISESERGTLVT